MNLVSVENEVTMTSREIAELTGKQHRHVKRDIEKLFQDLELDASKFGHTYYDSSNREQVEYRLDRYHTEVLVTGYDVKRRAAVIKRWYDLETGKAQPVATVKDPQLAAMVTMLTQLDQVKQEQLEQRAELAEVKAKLTSTPTDYYTVAGYASLRGLNLNVRRANVLGRKAAKLSREYGLDINKAHSEVFGAVNTYHVDVLCEVFN